MPPELLTANNLFSFYYSRIRHTTLWSLADRVIKYSRRFLFITRIVRYSAVIVSIIEKSVLLILISTLILTVLPILAAGSVAMLTAESIVTNKRLRELDLRLDREEIFVFAGVGEYGEAWTRSLSEVAAVYIVANPLKHRFIAAKADGGIIYVSKSFFLRLRRDYFDSTPEKMRYLFT